MTPTPLVSVGLPLFNGGATVADVVGSVLAQDHENIELVIADNASTDATEEICRELAAADGRIVYIRRPENIGLVPNFLDTLARARGSWFRWIGDGDRIEPTYVTRCLAAAGADERAVLVSTQIAYGLADGSTVSTPYRGSELRSPDPAVRFAEMLRLLTAGFADLDPLYSLLRRDPVARLPFRRILRGDEVFAATMALAGPWAHVPEVLAHRGWTDDRLAAIAPRLGVPRWHAPIANEIQTRALLRAVHEAGLTGDQRRRARAAVGRLYAMRLVRAGERIAHKASRILHNGAQTIPDRSNQAPTTSRSR